MSIQNYLPSINKPVTGFFFQPMWNQYSFALLTTDFLKIVFDANKYTIMIVRSQQKYLIVFRVISHI